MPLSEYEQRVLAQMERQLSSDDPKLAQTFAGGGARTSRVLLGSLVVLVGLGLLVAGVASSMTWLGLVGFLGMFGGVLLAMSRGKSVRPAEGGTSTPAAPPKKSSMMNRLDERWDRRKEQG